MENTIETTSEADDPASPQRPVTVLHVPPITSPPAVQASIVQAFREAEANAEG